MNVLMRLAWLTAAVAAALGLASTTAVAQQGSITLTNCSGESCYVHDNTWSIAKDVTGNTITDGLGTVTWTVTATKDSSAAPTYSVHGGVTVMNTGSGPATIGSIVVNLQKPNFPKMGSNASHVSIAADVADATSGDAASSASIAAAGSKENAATNAAWGTNNYTVAYTLTGASGTFVETACSGRLNFTDASNNTAFSLVPQPVIAAGESVTLLYEATFLASCLPAAGTQLRVEALVTFGNAGARGGSGATGTNVDINGSGTLDAGEDNVRTVPCRITLEALPAAPEETNDYVTVSDAGVTTAGTVAASNALGFDAFPATIADTTSWTLSVDIDSGVDGGSVCNSAGLSGAAVGGMLDTIVGYDTTDPLNPIPIYATYQCVAAAEGEATACVDISPPPLRSGDYCTFAQAGLGSPGHAYDLLAANFPTLYPSFVESGIPGAGGFSMKFTSSVAVLNYLPALGTPNKLTADLINPLTTVSGAFGGQTLALELNVALSDAAVTIAGFGDLYYCEPLSSLSGQTVRQILAIAETALGGGALPAGYNYAGLSLLAQSLNLSFAGTDPANGFEQCGVISQGARDRLSRTPCGP